VTQQSHTVACEQTSQRVNECDAGQERGLLAYGATMRCLAVFLALTTGCFTNGHHHTTAYHLNGVAAAVGGFLIWDAPRYKDCTGLDMTPPIGNPSGPSIYSVCDDNNSRRHLALGIGAGLVSAALIGIAVNYFFFHGEVEKADEALHPVAGNEQTATEIELLDVNTTNPQLINLTKEAAFAARKNNCRVVRLIYQRVRVIDADYSESPQGFLKDHTIERCVRQQDAL